MKIVSKSLLITITLISLFGFLAVENPVFAAAMSFDEAKSELCGSGDEKCKISDPKQIFTILSTVVQYTYTIFFIVAIIFIIVAAFNFLTAQGDPEKIKGARAQILWACVAIVIALISVAAAQIIKTFIGA